MGAFDCTCVEALVGAIVGLGVAFGCTCVGALVGAMVGLGVAVIAFGFSPPPQAQQASLAVLLPEPTYLSQYSAQFVP